MKTPKLPLRSIIWFLITISTCYSSLLAQQDYRLVSENQMMVIKGTSTLHDWEMTSSSAEGAGLFHLENDKLTLVKNLKITLPAESLKSGKKGMDKKAYTALKTSDFAQVSFELTSFDETNINEKKARGVLTVSGVSREVTLSITKLRFDQDIQVSGETSFNLTDFEVEPPRALAGTIRTGDAVTVEFNVVFKLK